MEVVFASLFGMNMSLFIGGGRSKSVVYFTDRVPSRVFDFQTPQDKLNSFCSIPHMPNLEPRVFGCTVYVHIPKVLQNKLDHCAIQCIFLDIHIFNRAIDVIIHARKKYQVSLDVSFHETEPFYRGEFWTHLFRRVELE